MTARHAAPRRRPFRAAWLRLLGTGRPGKLSDEDKATELWVDGLVEQVPGTTFEQDQGVMHGPLAPARRPQLATAARAAYVAVVRALPLDAIPWLRPGQGYEDTDTGSYEALAVPPALHADESISMTRAALAAGLARHVEDWTP